MGFSILQADDSGAILPGVRLSRCVVTIMARHAPVLIPPIAGHLGESRFPFRLSPGLSHHEPHVRMEQLQKKTMATRIVFVAGPWQRVLAMDAGEKRSILVGHSRAEGGFR